jgi:hypothetical protein
MCNFERVKNPARGRDGGRPGAVSLRSGRPIRPKGRKTVPARTRSVSACREAAVWRPAQRDPQRVADDVLDRLITAEEARRDYGVVVDAEGLNYAATERALPQNRATWCACCKSFEPAVRIVGPGKIFSRTGTFYECPHGHPQGIENNHVY